MLRPICRPVVRPVVRPLCAAMDPFYPGNLFSAGEQGIWLDPSDFSTLFQDASGTTPVAAVGQPVGLALDKRLGLALGADLVDTANTAAAWTPQGTNTVIQDGDAVKVTYVDNGLGASIALSSAGGLASNLVNGNWYEVRLQAKVSTGASLSFIIASTGMGSVAQQVTSTTYTDVVLRFFKGALAPSFQFSTMSAGESVWIRNISVREIAGNHAYQTTAASRPTLQQDSNGLYYLSFDGTDDGMATPSINFTGTDKMTAWAGAKANSAAASAVLFELSTTFGAGNPGSMGVLWPRLPYAVNFGLAGTAAASRSTSASADTGLRVISCAFDISSALTVDEIKPRVNGAAPSLLTVDAGPAGTGNFGSYPLYIGRRGGTTLPFNGRIYQLIVRGAASNAGQIAAGEAWCNSKTRAY